jgi:tRNA (uracil-5-)-methyltransferase TRM9
LIPAFLNSLPPGSIGADLGCGNGKYLSLRSVLVGRIEQQGIHPGNDILTVGLDRSANLIDLAAQNIVIGERVPKEGGEGAKRNEVCVGDAIQSFYRTGCFDYALSIATIHHFSTHQRRVEAVKELIRIVKPVSKAQHLQIHSQNSGLNSQYPNIAHQSGGRFLIYVWALEQRGESRRKFEIVPNSEDEKGKDLLVPWVLNGVEQAGDNAEEGYVYQRYYHVFEQGELELLVEEAASQMPRVNVKVEVSGWEKGNWYGIWKCVDAD